MIDVDITDHLTVLIKLASSDEYKEFIRLLNAELMGDKIFTYQIITYNDFISAIIHRYYYQNKYPSLTFLIINNQDIWYLVANTTSSIQLTSPLDWEIKEVEKDINSKIQLLCPGQAIDIEQMKKSLTSTLDLIPFKSNVNSYCLGSKFINSLPMKFNPIDNRPLNEYTVNAAKYWEYGLMGYFDTPLMTGMLKNPPIMTLVSPIHDGYQLGYPIINESKLEVESVKALIISIGVHSYDFFVTLKENTDDLGEMYSLFDMMINTNDSNTDNSLQTLIPSLWKCGWFLSLWCSILIKKYGKLSHHLTTRHAILNQAADSVFDGKRAMETMKLVNNTRCK